MKAAELRELPYQELTERLTETKEEYFNLRFQLATNQLESTAELSRARRDVARILTVMREQEIAAWAAQQEGEA